MKTTIDGAGRIVVPKALRRQLGLSGGQELEVSEKDGAIELRPVVTEVRMVDHDGVLVAQVDVPLPVLTADTVRDALEYLRR